MLKFKVEKMNYQLIIENTFCDYLSKKASEGWFFKRMIGDYVVYQKKEPRRVKYQFEYGYTDYEYDDYLKDVGYEYVFAYRNVVIYKNEDINAPDLHTDESVRLQSTKNMISKNPIVLFIILSMLFIPTYFVMSLLLLEPVTLGMIIKNFYTILIVLFSCVCFLIILLMTLQSLELKRIINKILNNKAYSYKILNILTNINSVIVLLFIFVLAIGVFVVIGRGLISDFGTTALILMTHGLLICLIFGLAKLMEKLRVEKRLIAGAVIMAFVLGRLGVSSLLEIMIPEKEVPLPPQSAYMSEYTDYGGGEGLFYESIYYLYNPKELSVAESYENFKTCKNEFVAIEFMKDDIIYHERSTRASNEFIENYMKEHGTYSSSLVEYKSYEEAFKTLKEYKHELVEECYYNEHFFIARKDHKLLVSYMQDEDNYIDNVIEHYFK